MNRRLCWQVIHQHELKAIEHHTELLVFSSDPSLASHSPRAQQEDEGNSPTRCAVAECVCVHARSSPLGFNAGF